MGQRVPVSHSCTPLPPELHAKPFHTSKVSCVLMDSFNSFVFGDFEVPPLQIPASTPKKTEALLPDDSIRLSTLSNEDPVDEPSLRDAKQQHAVQSASSLNPSGHDHGILTGQADVLKEGSLKSHATAEAPKSDDYSPRTDSSMGPVLDSWSHRRVRRTITRQTSSAAVPMRKASANKVQPVTPDEHGEGVFYTPIDTGRQEPSDMTTGPITARNFQDFIAGQACSTQEKLSRSSDALPTDSSNKSQRIPSRSLVGPPRRLPSNMYRPRQIPRSSSPQLIETAGTSVPDSEVSAARQPRNESSQNGKVNIRDSSRVRSVPVDFIASGELCDVCQKCGPERFHCNVCNFVFCDPCWEQQFPHRVKTTVPGSLPHERTDIHIAKKISIVLNSQLKEAQQEKLHMDDVDTTWFGVVREGHERPLFQDYGRYANLVAGIKNLHLGSISTLSSISDCNEALYPSLVSFVGQTGAGKSSLIKLLIDLKSDEDETFETPVVGAAGRDVATSEDVHLYLDPESSESQAPLLFADCEGLEGGERDPVGAKLKRKMAASQNNGPGSRRKPTSERELVWANSPRKQSRDFAVAHLYPRLLYTFSDVIVFVLKNPR